MEHKAWPGTHLQQLHWHGHCRHTFEQGQPRGMINFYALFTCLTHYTVTVRSGLVKSHIILSVEISLASLVALITR